MSDRFNPSAHLIMLRGKGGPTEYLPVAARIAWFRAEHPDGHIAVEAHTISADIAIFHARVSVPDGGSAEGWGSETPRDFPDYIEKASTKALGRALLALGYGTMQAGDDLVEGERIIDAPVPARMATPAPPAPRPVPVPLAAPAAPEPAAAPQPAVALSALQEETIANAWALAKAGDSYNATKAVIATLRPAGDKATWTGADREAWGEITGRWFAIRQAHYPETIPAAAGAAD